MTERDQILPNELANGPGVEGLAADNVVGSMLRERMGIVKTSGATEDQQK